MLTVKQIIAARSPGIPDDARLDALIEIATGRTSLTLFGTNYNLAVALRTLHIKAINDANFGQSGGVKSQSEGQLSISYGTAQGTTGDLADTAWGQELKGLIRSNTNGPFHRAMNSSWAPTL